jgi:type IV secretion system protein VirB10
MKLEMFKQAVRAKTSAMQDAAEPSAAADGAGRVAQARSDLDALRAGAGASYVDKLRQLQTAGILPEADPEREQRGDDDAYARFAGDKKEDRWALGSHTEAPESPYELRAGGVIPATLQTGINSDLPGQITALVAQDVRDTATGKFILIPQASRLVGTYGSDVKFGQSRVLVAWQRVVFPDGKALDIGAMPGSDGAGYAGFADQVDNHFDRLFGGALLLSAITAGVSMSQDSSNAQHGRLTVGGAMAQSLGQEMGQVSQELIRKQMNVAPTIQIRPGYRFNVQVTKDVTFNGPYHAFDYQRSISIGGGGVRARN